MSTTILKNGNSSLGQARRVFSPKLRNKGSKVNKPETPEKIEEMPKPIKYEAPSSTGGVQFKPCPKGGK